MINLVVALATESRPLIEHFGLSEDRSVLGFRVFRGDGVRLVVTGMGRVPCAGGVAALGERGTDAGMSAWLNVGIAGHAAHGVGEGIHAVRILEAATGRSWYPPQVVSLPGRAEALCTVDAPETSYTGGYAYDMEASAFYATAVRYATGELVQVYKIISDNREQGVDSVARHTVRDAIARHLPAIEALAAGLSALAQEVNATRPRLDDFERIVNRWHFSVAQQHQLRELLRQWATLMGAEPVWSPDVNRCPSARAVLGEIRLRLDAVYRSAEGSGE